MVETAIGGLLLNGSLVMLILGSIVEVAIDIREMDAPEFLPSPLAGLPSSHPATALGVLGVVLMVLGVGIEMASVGSPPGGRLIIGLVALVAFLFSGGYVVGGGETEG